MKTSPLAGKPAEQNILVNIPRLVTAYYTGIPDIAIPNQRVAFGTSGHRGSSLKNSFNENHILAITQAIQPRDDYLSTAKFYESKIDERCPHIINGLHRPGFSGGWLDLIPMKEY